MRRRKKPTWFGSARTFLVTLRPFDNHYNPDPLLTRCLRPQGFGLETEGGSIVPPARGTNKNSNNNRSAHGLVVRETRPVVLSCTRKFKRRSCIVGLRARRL